MAGIRLVKKADPELLERHGVKQWDIWTKEVSKFPWTYDCTEHCFFLAGEVLVTPDGGEPLAIAAGDFVTFETGLACTWDIRSPVRKHYRFED